MVVWTWGVLEACLFWSYIDVIVVRVKVSRGIVPFSPIEIDIADATLVNRPMGRFAWTNHIYFQITQPGSSLHLYTNRGGYEEPTDTSVLVLSLLVYLSSVSKKRDPTDL
jgi:hypothetical protein